ncbi:MULTISPECIES: PTS sugar transporter subunit IIB [Gammaproteobacteria]|uniref:PTS sugar transporter subunit IIB n=1 Tax=Gammaproteobacteria TaxID=1236 RepID=UPI002165F28A|nr:MULTISPECIES: PTS sugar transporter subunit IIB [Gammaproteobacteria]MCS3406229.1 PTS sugar transporter subunit IIB [Serratia sp. AKBS12]MDH4429565.1 PTS sugar transporter subunit IIB [Pseudomonas shirazica]HEI8868993.1 PTS sugar transporter subunit IIB [Serratia odorifera]
MKRIVLCCAAGMSTSMLVKRMQDEAAKRQLVIEIKAVPAAEFEAELPNADVVLLGPQVKYELARFNKIAEPYGLPVAVIDMMDYGTMRGDKVLDHALNLIA